VQLLKIRASELGSDPGHIFGLDDDCSWLLWMNDFLLVFTCFTGLLAFACLLAGWASLVMPDPTELANLRRKMQEVSSPGLRGEMERIALARHATHSPERMAEQWRAKRDSRKLLCIGLALTIVAFISDHFAVLPR
jgi:hypothetical protein